MDVRERFWSKTLDREKRRRALRESSAAPHLVGLFDRQRAFIADKSRRKTLRCGRRAGKTVTLRSDLLDKAGEIPDAVSAYIALSRPVAERLMWTPLKRLNERAKLGIEFNDQKLIAYMPNGHQLWLAGADDKKEREKLRGHAFANVALDESQAFDAYLEYLVEDVLGPAMEDYDGYVTMAGTPNASSVGYFHDADVGIIKGWKPHSWTVLDNEQFPRWAGKANWEELALRWIEAKKLERGWNGTEPRFMREYMGRWIRDSDSLVFGYDPGANSYEELPGHGQWIHVLGVDFGHSPDPCAFVVWAYSPQRREAYLVDEHEENGLDVTAIADRIRKYQKHYDISTIVADCGALGKTIADELRRRHNIPVKPAEKTTKAAAIELMNDDFRRGFIKAPRDWLVTKQWLVLQWTEDRKREDPRYPNDLADAALYGWRELRHYLHEPARKTPQINSPEWNEEQDELAPLDDDDGDDRQQPWWSKA